MTEIEELLAQLKELDPETYRDFREICAMTAFDSSDLDDPNITTPVYGWCLQGLILEAIGARGWGFYVSTECDNWWDVENISDMEITYAASILLPDDEMCDFWDGLQLEWCRGDSPAEALLRAYNAALEAEREAGR